MLNAQIFCLKWPAGGSIPEPVINSDGAANDFGAEGWATLPELLTRENLNPGVRNVLEAIVGNESVVTRINQIAEGEQ